MALPQLNVTPKYTMTIPSLKKEVKFRPYLVKEEKVLLMAMESQDSKAIIRALTDTIEACIEEKDVDIKSLATFDVEYLFMKIRAKSVGEFVDVKIKCSECETKNDYKVNVDDITLNVPVQNNIIKLTEEISVEMKYPNYTDLSSLEVFSDNHQPSAKDVMTLAAKGISAIVTDNERYDVTDVTKQELDDFIDSLTSQQFQMLNAFFEGMPQMKHDVKFNCSDCNHENNLTLQGLNDFF